VTDVLNRDSGNEGEPIDEGGPEWDSVEAERDYWKALAQSYGAKLTALKCTLEADWEIVGPEDGRMWAQMKGGDGNLAYPLPTIDEAAKDDRT
jgi:hypothetical protein